MKQLTTGRDWEYAYEKALNGQLAVFKEELERGGDAPHQYLRGVIYGIRVAIGELVDARSKHRQDGDADFEG
jgi:hypothetical protein